MYCDEKGHFMKPKSFNNFKLSLLYVEMHTKTLQDNVSRYDGKTKVAANGYRSIVKVTEQLINQCVETGDKIVFKVSNINLVKEYLKTWTKALGIMKDILEMTMDIMELSYNDQLFPEKPNCQTTNVMKLSERLMNLDVSPFYGDLSAFHLKGDCSQLGRLLTIAMAAYSDFFGRTMTENCKSLKKLPSYATDDRFLANRLK